MHLCINFFFFITTVDFICSEKDLSDLCTIISVSNSEEYLSDTVMTMFAPTDGALEKLSSGLFFKMLDDIDFMKEIILFHTVPAVIFHRDDLPCVAGEKSLLLMGNGEESRTICVDDYPLYQKGAGNDDTAIPTIVTGDYEMCNGVVHKIDTFLLFE